MGWGGGGGGGGGARARSYCISLGGGEREKRKKNLLGQWVATLLRHTQDLKCSNIMCRQCISGHVLGTYWMEGNS